MKSEDDGENGTSNAHAHREGGGGGAHRRRRRQRQRQPRANHDAPEDTRYYAVLNVPPDAAREQIRAAYRRLSQTYHPDRHLDGEARRNATEMFTRVKEAYDVLSHPMKREVYDAYGMAGVRSMERSELATFNDVRQHFEKQRRYRGGGGGGEGDEETAQEGDMPLPSSVDSLLTVSNSIDVSVDATGLAQLLPDFLDGDLRYIRSAMRVRGAMLGTQGTVYLTTRDSITVQYDVATGFGGGGGDAEGDASATAESKGIVVAGRHQFSGDMVGEAALSFVGAQVPPIVSAKMWRRTSKFTSMALEGSYSQRYDGLLLVLSHARQLSDRWHGQLSWAAGPSPGFMATFVRSAERWSLSFSARVGMGATGVKASIKHLLFDAATYVKARAQLSLAGWALELGAARELAMDSIVGTGVQLAHTGISVRVKAGRGDHRVGVPILLLPNPHPMAFVAITGTLSAVLASTEWFIVKPLRWAARERQRQRGQTERREEIEAARVRAQQALQLMQRDVERSRVRERARENGLLIVRGVYGDPDAVARLGDTPPDAKYLQGGAQVGNDDGNGGNGSGNGGGDGGGGYVPEVCDVTDALQYMVDGVDSSLTLYGATSKASLNGFYDPTFHAEDKALRVWYTVGDRAYDVTVDDDERLYIGGDGGGKASG